MGGKNYRWQKQWSVDPEDSTCTHIEGLMFAFEWRGNAMTQRVVTDPASLAYIERKKQELGKDYEAHLGKLARQARTIFLEKLQ